MSDTIAATVGLPALADLRRQRRRNRLASQDWFEAAYRVYLTALVGGFAIIVLTGVIGGHQVSASELIAVRSHGPAVVGLLAALAIATGLRSGSRGGPLAVEAAEVRHVLLAPVDRRRALLPLAVKSARTTAFGGVVAGAVVGVLADRRLPHQRTAWALAGAAAGLGCALLFTGSAFVASGLRLKRALATLIAAIILGGAIADVAGKLPWPTTAIGSLALWPLRTHPLDAAIIVVALAAVLVGPLLLGRLSLDDAERRTGLVGGMRMAVTLQDLRSVVVLRRQLVAERPRRRPWFKWPRWAGHWGLWRRGWQSVLRTPASRIGRMLVLSFGAAALAVPVLRGTPALVLVIGLVAYVIGLDLIEPLAQAVDRPDRTDLMPIDTGAHLVRLLAVPAVTSVVIGALGGGVAELLARSAIERRAVLATGIAVALTGLAGGTVSVVMSVPTGSAMDGLLPPEIAGMRIVLRSVWPMVLSCLGTIPLLFAYRAADKNLDSTAGLLRGLAGAALTVVAVAYWVRHREAAKKWWADQMKQAQDAKKTKPASGAAPRGGH